MPELMLKPGWPNAFRRTITAGGKMRIMTFKANEPVKVTAAEMKLLAADIGLSLFEVMRDEKDRPRFIETAAEITEDPTQDEVTEQKADVAHV